LNAGQLEAVDFFVLPEQGIVGRPEQRVIKYAPQSAHDSMATIDRAQGKSCPWGERREQGESHDRNRQESQWFVAIRHWQVTRQA
jgi:hypothetical protein